MGKALMLSAFLMLSACQTVPVDTFCQTHKAADFRPSQKVFDVMTQEERRSSLKILKEGEKRCGWRP